MEMENLLKIEPDFALTQVKEFAHRIEGVFVDYDENRFAVIVPLIENKRIQRVFGVVDRINQKVIFKSIVCRKDQADFELLMDNQRNFTYSKFIKEGDDVLISSSISLENATYDILKSIILEVAANADIWENKFTGKDVY